MSLLSVSADAKTVKGEALGILTGVMYFAPADISGYEVCPKATAGCKAACLYSAGRGAFSNVQQARIAKTKRFFEDRPAFLAELVEDIAKLERKAARDGMKPAVRLNGTSDIAWEKIRVKRGSLEFRNVMEAFPLVQFYDYTKIAGRKAAVKIPNYHLTFSLAENNDVDAQLALDNGMNVAVVMKLKRNDEKPLTFWKRPVVDGDASDVRFNDPKGGHVVALFAKGAAAKDTSGFVRDPNEELIELRKAAMTTKQELLDSIEAGDRVTFMGRNGLKLVNGKAVPEYKKRTGTAQKFLIQAQPGVVVLNMGGRYGTPACVTVDNIVSVRKKATG